MNAFKKTLRLWWPKRHDPCKNARNWAKAMIRSQLAHIRTIRAWENGTLPDRHPL